MQPTRVVSVERKSFREFDCSVAQCLEVIGEWWTMLIVRDVFLGVHRFDVLQARLGISRNVLTQRLQKLVDDGILRRQAYQERPIRYEYRLTDKGRDLWPVLTALRQWGDRYAAPDGPRISIEHRACGHVAEPELRCPACGEAVGARDYRAVPGPGDPTGHTLPARRASTATAGSDAAAVVAGANA
jgi:DNA-binding HxlR family transcriptional regulator